MRLIEPALRANNAERTKKQKVSCISYWTTFYAAYEVDAEAYGRTLPDEGTKRFLRVPENGSARLLRRICFHVPLTEREVPQQCHAPITSDKSNSSVLKGNKWADSRNSSKLC